MKIAFIVICFVILVLYLLRMRWLRFCQVVGSSMLPTLVEGDIVKWNTFDSLEDGEIYVYRPPNNSEKWVIKRLSHHNKNGCYFLGDNLKESVDSRTYGYVDYEMIIGKVIKIYKKGQIIHE